MLYEVITYHHHLGINQWNKEQMHDYSKDTVEIDDFEIRFPTPKDVDQVVDSLTKNHYTVYQQDGEVMVIDPVGIKVHLTSRSNIQ